MSTEHLIAGASAQIGRATKSSTACTVEQKVIGVVTISSPGPTPSAASPTSMASVAELTANAAARR